MENTKIPLVPMVKVISGGKHTVGREGCCSCLFFVVFKLIFYAVFFLLLLSFFLLISLAVESFFP